ncbi:hypothetical protein AHF37_06849 [Paragonimus kellicotti]|nr:hypothetical protein AHF37_06849 [Paragonimus kellicotti]
MSYEDFITFFTRLEVCHLGLESLEHGQDFRGKRRLEESIFAGQWEKNVNAGGCINNRSRLPQLLCVCFEEITSRLTLTARHRLTLQKVTYRGNKQYLVRCRNPWGGNYEWKGDWADRSPLWNQVSLRRRNQSIWVLRCFITRLGWYTNTRCRCCSMAQE